MQTYMELYVTESSDGKILSLTARHSRFAKNKNTILRNKETVFYVISKTIWKVGGANFLDVHCTKN